MPDDYRTFVTWSGGTKGFADAFATWLDDVLRASRPFVSIQDLKSGLWPPQVVGPLTSVRAGVVLLTQATKHAPWLVFETGGLLRSVSNNEQLCILLLDGDSTGIDGPLAALQMQLFTEAGVLKVVQQVNAALAPEDQEDPVKLTERTARFWPSLWGRYEEWQAARDTGPKPAKRPVDEMMAEVLDIVRGLAREVRHIGLDAPRADGPPPTGLDPLRTSVDVDPAERAVRLALEPPPVAAQALAGCSPYRAADILRLMPSRRAMAILEEMDREALLTLMPLLHPPLLELILATPWGRDSFDALEERARRHLPALAPSDDGKPRSGARRPLMSDDLRPTPPADKGRAKRG